MAKREMTTLFITGIFTGIILTQYFVSKFAGTLPLSLKGCRCPDRHRGEEGRTETARRLGKSAALSEPRHDGELKSAFRQLCTVDPT